MRNRVWGAGAVIVLVGAGFSLPLERVDPRLEATAGGGADVAASESGAVAAASRSSGAEARAAARAEAREAAAAAAVVSPTDSEQPDRPEREPALAVLEGSASYYADMFEGRTTASGRTFRQAEMVAAHKKLPFGSRLRVTNLANGREVEVEVVDRGPYAHGRILDLSKSAARKLDFIRRGHTRVRIEVLERGS